jgi:hypothetical protein
LVLWLFGCVETLHLIIDRRDTANPIFRIESNALLAGSGVAIPNFSVIRWKAEGREPEAMWRIESESGRRTHVHEIVYGVVPKGFNEIVAARALQLSERYEASTMEPGWVGSIGFSISSK